MNNYQQALAILTTAHQQTLEQLSTPEDQYHRLYIDTHFKRVIHYFGSITGTGVGVAPAEELPPATTIGGEAIQHPAAVTLDDLLPQEDAVDVLRRKVQEAYTVLLTTPTDVALTTFEPLVLRGLAKRMGLKVTQDEPKTLTKKFIDVIKTRIRKEQDDHNKKLAEATRNLEAAGTDEEKAAAQAVLTELQNRQS